MTTRTDSLLAGRDLARRAHEEMRRWRWGRRPRIPESLHRKPQPARRAPADAEDVSVVDAADGTFAVMVDAREIKSGFPSNREAWRHADTLDATALADDGRRLRIADAFADQGR